MTTVLPAFGYVACMATVVPAIAIVSFFSLIDRVATAGNLPGIGHVLFKLLEFVDTPWKVIGILLFALALFAAGCVRACRGCACLTVGPTAPGQLLVLVPSALGTAVSESELMPFIVHELGISGSAATKLLQSLHRDQGPTAYVFHSATCDRYLSYVDYL